MKIKWIGKGMELSIIVLIIVSGFGEAVHYLWNWLMPNLFGVHPITFWQAVGLLGLCWILFGGFGWFGGRPRRHMYSGNRMTERWGQMTPEQRAKFREGLRGRCDQPGPTTAEPQA